MRLRTITLGLLAFLLCASGARALTDEEYRHLMRTSSEFSSADAELTAAWKRAYGPLVGQAKKKLLADQQQWVKYGRDRDAARYIERGMSRAEAYAAAARNRTAFLANIRENRPVSSQAFASDDDELDEDELPENCGIVKASIPIEGDLHQLLLDDGKGRIRTFYYHHQRNSSAVKCGEIVGAMCFDVLRTVPVSSRLRSSGATGETMTLIHECRSAN